MGLVSYKFSLRCLFTCLLRFVAAWCLLGMGIAAVALAEQDKPVQLSSKLLDSIAKKYGDSAVERLKDWAALMESGGLPDVEEAVKLAQANEFFNRVQWLTDLAHWGQEDYWATPVETLASNGGDCEDFSIGKYFTLLQTKVDNEKLRITYVKSLTYNQAHMVLAYYPQPDAEPLILDNINKTILPASQRDDLLPIYSFNGESIWLAKARGKKLNADSQKSLPQWKGVNERLLQELSGEGER